MEGETAGLGCERLQQKPARGRVAGNHQSRDHLEIAAGLLLGPRATPGRQLLQAEGVAASCLMANVTTDVAGPFFQEDGLDRALEKPVIKRLLGRRGTSCLQGDR